MHGMKIVSVDRKCLKTAETVETVYCCCSAGGGGALCCVVVGCAAVGCAAVAGGVETACVGCPVDTIAAVPPGACRVGAW